MGGIILLVLMVIAFAVILIGSGIKSAGTESKDDDTITVGRYFRIAGVIAFVLFGFLFAFRCITTVDAGEVKVQVMFGRVLDNVLTEGLSTKSPFASTNAYNIQLRETTMDVKDNNALQALTSDKLAVNIDATIWWRIISTDVKMIRRDISADETVMDDVVVFPAVRSAVRDAVVFYTFDEIITKRAELSQKIDEILIKLTQGKGSKIERVLIRNVVPEDNRVTASIGEKLQQQQQLQAKQYELKKAEMDAQIRIKTAEGISTAQNIIQKTLTPEYLTFERIQMMKTLANSPNTTFIFDNGGSVPMVFNKDIDKK
jgi:regulator of protease activity HflC (stomatin/prohibitin superfamily)